ncbi:MAG: LCP family protein [bacterium]
MIFIKNSYLYIGVCSVLFLLAFVSSYFFVKNSSLFKKEVVTPTPTEEPAQVEEVPEDSIYTTVLLGYGGAGHDGGTLSDSIILIEADPSTKKASIISIPRDLWVTIPTDFNNTSYNKINAAYSVGLDDTRYPNKRPEFKGKNGGGNLAKSVVSQIIGANVDYFAAVDFGRFTKIIDTLGKIEVDVPKTFDDYFYPVKGLENETCGKSAEEIADLHSKYSEFELEKQFTCRYEHLHFDRGLITIDGEAALKFVRSRHGDGDLGRSERQFAVLEAINKKLITLSAFTKGGSLLNTLFGMVKTDLSLNKIYEIYQILGEGGGYKVTKIHLSEDNSLTAKKGPQGQYILIPKAGINNYTEIQNIIQQVMPSN